MRSLLRLWLVAGFLAGAATAFGDASAAMSVQVKNGQIRATPSFLGKVVAPLSYGDRVQVLETRNDWMNVTGPGGQSGWVHSSALTKKKIVMSSGSDFMGSSVCTRLLRATLGTRSHRKFCPRAGIATGHVRKALSPKRCRCAVPR